MSKTASTNVGPERLLRLRDVQDRVGLRKTFIYGAVKRGDFPAPVRISPRAVAWPSSSVDAWIAQQIAGSLRVPSAEK